MYPNQRKQRFDVLRTVLKIINEGPALQRNTEKVPNGANRFAEEHHGEYEARERRAGDAAAAVDRHNAAAPKLVDELARRKSITRVTTINYKRVHKDFDPNCAACVKLLTLKELKRKGVKPKCTGHMKMSSIKRNCYKGRMPKKETKKRHARARGSRTDKGNQSFPCMRIKDNIYSAKSMYPPEDNASWYMDTYKEDFENNTENTEKSKKSDYSTSLSSYHTFPSMGHEPMGTI